jgi:solute:Na+ symporter, SSS family
MSHFSPWLDGPIVGLYLLAMMAAGVFVKKYVGKVEDFLGAGRGMDVFCSWESRPGDRHFNADLQRP